MTLQIKNRPVSPPQSSLLSIGCHCEGTQARSNLSLVLKINWFVVSLLAAMTGANAKAFGETPH